MAKKDMNEPRNWAGVPVPGLVRCWCGSTVKRGVMHYPGEDPENGPAHRPSAVDPETMQDDPPPGVGRSRMRHMTWPEAVEASDRDYDGPSEVGDTTGDRTDELHRMLEARKLK